MSLSYQHPHKNSKQNQKRDKKSKLPLQFIGSTIKKMKFYIFRNTLRN